MQTLSVSDRVVLFCVALFAVFLSIKYFPGIENNGYYAGFVIQAIHPDLMAKDPIVGDALSATRSPYKLTIYYLFPKLLGEIWLDDRFIAVLYVLTVAATFWIADRIAIVLGAVGLAERLIILMLFLKDHVVLENAVNFAHHPDFHHSALALPVGMGLIYAALRRASVISLLAWGFLLALISVQVAPFALGMALIARATLAGPRERALIAGILALGLIVAAYVLFVPNAIPDEQRIPIWDLLVYEWYEGMVVPFDPRFSGLSATFIGNASLAALFGAALCMRSEARPALTRARAIIVIAAASWVVLGLFVQFAPDFLKFPQILLFPIARQLQYPQILAYITLAVILFRRLDRRSGTAAVVVSGFSFFLLMLAGPGNFGKWTFLFAASLAFAISARYFLVKVIPAAIPALSSGSGGRFAPAEIFKHILGLAFAATMTLAMGVALWQKAPAWMHLFKTGVHGASGSAPWIGVDTYLRVYTTKDAVVLPLQFLSGDEISIGEKFGARLRVSRNVASRSGRAVSAPMMLAKGLDLDYFRFAQEQRRLLASIAESWMAGDATTVAANIDNLRPSPEYVIVPSLVASRIVGPAFPFVKETEINDFAILKRLR